MVKKQLPLYQNMLSFTYCKWPLLYHRKFSLTQLSGCSYIIESSPLTQCRRLLLCKRVLSPRYECGRIYIKGHSLYLLWVAAPISILNNEGGHSFTSAHFQKAAASSFIIRKGVMAKRFLLSQRNMWLEGLFPIAMYYLETLKLVHHIKHSTLVLVSGQGRWLTIKTGQATWDHEWAWSIWYWIPPRKAWLPLHVLWGASHWFWLCVFARLRDNNGSSRCQWCQWKSR